MTTTANRQLANDIVRNRLPVQLDLGDLAEDATAFRNFSITNQASFNQAASGLLNLEQKILNDADVVRRVVDRWEQNGDKLSDFLTREEIDQLNADDDATKRFLKTISRLVGYTACRALG
jgi:hypothetical protein